MDAAAADDDELKQNGPKIRKKAEKIIGTGTGSGGSQSRWPLLQHIGRWRRWSRVWATRMGATVLRLRRR